jgi:type I restriction enzyme M protein
MFEQTFKNIDDILHKDAGCSSELDYVEQTSWILFLKYLEDLERDRRTKAELSGKTYEDLLPKQYRWDVWAAPKTKDGKLDHHKALTGDDLRDFVNDKLFPYLRKFRVDATSADSLEYKIGEIFHELKNKIQSGYNLREVINLVDQLRFRTQSEKHEMSHLYEDKIKNMGNAGRNGGEYYTPRPLIRTIVKVIAPELGQTIYDGAAGSTGFLVEAFKYLKEHNENRTTAQDRILQTKTLFAKEKKSLAYIIGIMNLILHGVETPNIIHTNTLAINLQDIQEKDRYDIVLANPPFGGKVLSGHCR